MKLQQGTAVQATAAVQWGYPRRKSLGWGEKLRAGLVSHWKVAELSQ